MSAIAFVGNGNEPRVKPPLFNARLVTTDQQNRLTCGIECEGDTPDLIFPAEAKLFHIGVLRTLESIDRRSAETWAKLPQEAVHGQAVRPVNFEPSPETQRRIHRKTVHSHNMARL